MLSSRDQFSRVILTEYEQYFYSNDTENINNKGESENPSTSHLNIAKHIQSSPVHL